MQWIRAALLLAVVVSNTACFQMTTVLRIYGDGAGWIDHRMMFSAAALAQLKQLSAFTGGRGQGVFDPLSEQQARDLAGVIGQGVTYVQSQVIVEPNGRQGREATYSFIDINQLKISTQPATPQGASPPGLDDGEMVTFFLSHEPSGSAVLRIQVPEPNWIGSIGTLNASGQLALLKTLLAGAKIVLAVEPAGEIVRTSSPYVNDQRVTLLEVDLDEILKDETLVPRLTAAQTQEEVMAIMRTAAGLKINLDREITIEFTPSKRH